MIFFRKGVKGTDKAGNSTFPLPSTPPALRLLVGSGLCLQS